MGIHPYSEVPDPDLEIGAWGGGEAGLPQKFFWPFRPQFGLKIRGGLSPSPRSATVLVQQIELQVVHVA